MSEGAVQALISETCQALEKTAEMMQVQINKDIGSVARLEDIIIALREAGNADSLRGAEFMVGAYLGEIIRNVAGGTWEQSSAGDLSLLLRGVSYHPISKVRRFSADPAAGDSLGFFARAVVASARAQQAFQRDGPASGGSAR